MIGQRNFVVSDLCAVTSSALLFALRDSTPPAGDEGQATVIPSSCVITRVQGYLTSVANGPTGVSVTLGHSTTAADWRSYGLVRTASLQPDGAGATEAYFDISFDPPLDHMTHASAGGAMDAFRFLLTGGAAPTANLRLYTHFRTN